jgi:hypothetical protein
MTDARPHRHRNRDRPPGLGAFAVTILVVLVAVAALALAAWAWFIELGPGQDGQTFELWLRIALRSGRVLAFSEFPAPGDVKPGAYTILILAHVLGALAYILLASRIALFALGDWLTQIGLANRRGHDLVIGEGDAAFEYARWFPGRSIHIAPGLTTRGGSHASLERLGDISRELLRGGARSARHIVVDEGEDADTWQVAQEIAGQCPQATVTAYISDAWTEERLTRSATHRGLRTFSYASGSARQVMLAHPPYILARKILGQAGRQDMAGSQVAQHILVIGFGSVGQSLVREFLATSVTLHPEKMMVTIIDPRIDAIAPEFSGRMPALSEYADLCFLKGDLAILSEPFRTELEARLKEAPLCAIYIAIDVRKQPLGFAYLVRDRAIEFGLRAPIFICAEHGAGLPAIDQGAGLLPEVAPEKMTIEEEKQRARSPKLYARSLASFGSWAQAFDGAGLRESPRPDTLARRFHRHYLDLNKKIDPERPSHRTWEYLPDNLRISNRRSMYHIRAKLDAAGVLDLDTWLDGQHDRKKGEPRACFVLPLITQKQMPPMPDEMVETLAQLEHRRWRIDRALTGWRYGFTLNGDGTRVADNEKRLHPDMTDWGNLGDQSKTYNRESIRELFKLVSDGSLRSDRLIGS